MITGMKNWWSSGPKPSSDEQSAPPAETKEELDSAETETHQPNPDQDLQKALNAAKDWGTYLYSVGKKATTSVTSKAKTITTKNLLDEFDKEQQSFVVSKREADSRKEAAVPPWVGYENEAQLKDQILSLSNDKRHFLRSPPQGASFVFDFNILSPVAMATLEADENLRIMRFDLVPKKIKEEEFWRNYFYRISLIKQSAQLSSMAKAVDQSSQSHQSNSSGNSETYERVSPERDLAPQHLSESDMDFASCDLAAEKPTELSDEEKLRLSGEPQSQEENQDDWEEELQRELTEFELVSSQVIEPNDAELEREIMEQLAKDK